VAAIASWDLWDLQDGFDIAASDISFSTLKTGLEEWTNWIGADSWDPGTAETDKEGRVLLFE
jgi:hypothetical protein